MKKPLVSFLLILILAAFVTAQTPSKDIAVFYGEGCPHCARAISYLNELQKNYTFNLKLYEVYFNDTNRQIFETYTNRFNSTIHGVPTIFVNDKMIVGFSDQIGGQIKQELEKNNLEIIQPKTTNYDLIGWIFVIVVMILVAVIMFTKLKGKK